MCFLVGLGLLLPRVTLAVLWFFDKLTGVYSPWWLGLLGFLLLPYTTLAYALIHLYSGTVTTSAGNLIVLAVAVLLDTGVWGGTGRSRSRD